MTLFAGELDRASPKRYIECLLNWEEILPSLAACLRAYYQQGSFDACHDAFALSRKLYGQWSLVGEKGRVDVLFEYCEDYLFGRLTGVAPEFECAKELLQAAFDHEGGRRTDEERDLSLFELPTEYMIRFALDEITEHANALRTVREQSDVSSNDSARLSDEVEAVSGYLARGEGGPAHERLISLVATHEIPISDRIYELLDLAGRSLGVAPSNWTRLRALVTGF